MKQFLLLSLWGAVLCVGCRKEAAPLAQGWSEPTKITDTKDSLVGGVLMYSWHNRVIALQGQDDRSAKCFLLNTNDTSWRQAQITGVPHGYYWNRPVLNEDGDRVYFREDYKESNQLVLKILCGRMRTDEGLTVMGVTEEKWVGDKQVFFGKTPSDIAMATPGGPTGPALGFPTIVQGLELYIPFSLEARKVTYRDNGYAVAPGPHSSGILHSGDCGRTWQIDVMSREPAWYAAVCSTKERFYYFFSNQKTDMNPELWCAERPITGGPWAESKNITMTCGSTCDAVSQDDTVHLLWTDRRHEKRRFNPVYPYCGNYEVAYSRRKDSEANWSKPVILSKGVVYAFSPVLSVEGDNVVVAWAGIHTWEDWHSDFDPNGIYYVTSMDRGGTWTKPLRVTDNIKAGITAGDVHVVLQRGIIHLSYIQGKLQLRRESPGLTKLNQPPWPIYYQQRPFPK